MKKHGFIVKPVFILAMICLMATLAPFSTIPISHASPTIVGNWRLDETSGTVASDSSGNHLNGTLINGPVWTAGKIGNSLQFDGVNDEVDLGTPAALQFTGAMSAAAWIYIDSFASQGRIISKENGANSRSWSLYVNTSGKGVFQIATGASASITVETAGTLPVGQWVHLAGVFEPGTALRIYVNGVLSNTNLSSIPSTQYNNISHVFIGRRPDYSYAFSGKIDEVYAFGNALTDADVAALAGNQSPQITLVPGFETISVYLPGEGAGSSVQLYYRTSGTSTWKSAYTPVYDAATNQFRGSIVKLAEDTSYDVKADVYSGGTLLRTATGTVKTWTSNPVISQTISLSSIYSGGALQINNRVGSDTGWIKIVNDTGLVIDGQKLATAAVTVTNSKYLILENFIVKGGILHGIMLDSTDSNIRIINADISGWGREVVGTTETGALGQPLDANGNEINHDAGIDIQDGYNIVVERSYIHDANGWANSWDGVTMGGLTYNDSHPQGPNAVFLRGKGGIVLRYNDFVGSDSHRYNDVVESYYNGDQNGGPYKDADIYGNFFGFGNDDTMEFDGGQMNVRFYNNRYEQTYCGLSIIPNLLGPSYVFNNLGTNMGDIRRSGGGAVVKGGGDSTLGLGWSFLFNNTFYTKTNGFATFAYNSKRDMNAVTRNNIIVLTRANTSGIYNIRDDGQRAENSFDFDALGNTTISNGYGRISAAAGNEAHVQWGIAALTAPAAGLYTLKTTVGTNEVNVIDKGTPINNFADNFAGAAPDIGAIEYGDSGLMPKRPIPLTSNKYMVTVPQGSNTATFTISPGSYSGSYAIKKSASDDWYTVSPASGTFTAGNGITFTITVDRNKASFDQSSEFSTLFVRLPNGLSVPVSVTALQ